MLKTLKFRLNVPTPYVFMLRFLKAAQSDAKVRTWWLSERLHWFSANLIPNWKISLTFAVLWILALA